MENEPLEFVGFFHFLPALPVAGSIGGREGQREKEKTKHENRGCFVVVNIKRARRRSFRSWGGGVGDGEIKGDVKNYLALDLRESKVTWKACVSCVVRPK